MVSPEDVENRAMLQSKLDRNVITEEERKQLDAIRERADKEEQQNKELTDEAIQKQAQEQKQPTGQQQLGSGKSKGK